MTKTIHLNFDDAVERITEALKSEGFGVLTEIDIKATLKKKLDVDFKNYKILGACNPDFAFRALQAEDKIGIMLPCNVTVIDQGQENVEISIVDPSSVMAPVENQDLEPFAGEVKGMLSRVLEKL